MHHHKQNLQGHWNFCQGNSPFLAKRARAEGAGPVGQQILKSSALLQSLLGDFLKQQLDVILDLDGFEVPAVALEGHAVGSDEELLEVPGDVVAAHGRPDDVLRVGHQRRGVVVREGQGLLQEGEERVGVLPVHLALLEDGEVGLVPVARPHVLQRAQDLLVGGILLRRQSPPSPHPITPHPSPRPRLPAPLLTPGPHPQYLVAELVAGEAEDLQPAGPEAALQLVELQEVAGGGASERRHVHHQQHLAPQRAERQRLRRAQRPRRDPRQHLSRHGSSPTDRQTQTHRQTDGQPHGQPYSPPCSAPFRPHRAEAMGAIGPGIWGPFCNFSASLKRAFFFLLLLYFFIFFLLSLFHVFSRQWLCSSRICAGPGWAPWPCPHCRPCGPTALLWVLVLKSRPHTHQCLLQALVPRNGFKNNVREQRGWAQWLGP